jgi:hypothetical protein
LDRLKLLRGENWPLEVMGEVGKGSEFEEVLAGRGLIDDLVLENPGEIMRDEDRMKAGRECGINVGAGAVADHPGIGHLAFVVHGKGPIGLVMLFGENFDRGEVGSETGAVEFVFLFEGIPLSDHNEAVASG